MHELNRVFQGDDVDRLRLVDLIEQRGQRRRLAAAGRAGDEDQPGFFLRDFLENRREAQGSRAWERWLRSLRRTIAKLPRCRKILTRKRASSPSE